MTNPEDHPLYEMVLRMTLWGEPHEKIIQKLSYNRVEMEEAEVLYHAARAERIATVRSIYWKKCLTGLLWVAGSAAVFCIFWFGLGLIPRILIYACFGCTGMGLWKLIDGFAGVLMAANKRGSLEDDF